MWNEKQLLEDIDNYFDNMTLEQFFNDLRKTGSINYVEDVDDKN